MSNKVYITREFQCSIEVLFRWITEAKCIALWFGPQHLKVGEINIDFCIDGNYSIELIKEKGERFFIQGSYLEINPPSKVVFNLSYKGLNISPPDSVVKMQLEAIENAVTKLSFIQQFESMPNDMENRTVAWEHMFNELKTLLEKKY